MRTAIGGLGTLVTLGASVSESLPQALVDLIDIRLIVHHPTDEPWVGERVPERERLRSEPTVGAEQVDPAHGESAHTERGAGQAELARPRRPC